jgi:hypothetical protein
VIASVSVAADPVVAPVINTTSKKESNQKWQKKICDNGSQFVASVLMKTAGANSLS